MASSQRPKRPPPTHFLCLPLVTPASRPQLAASLAAFTADAVRARALGGFALPPDAVRPLGTLHLTLGVMSFPQRAPRAQRSSSGGGGGGGGVDAAVATLKALQPRVLLAGVAVAPAAAAAAAPTPAVAGPDPDMDPDPDPNLDATPLRVSLRGLAAMGGAPAKATVLYAPPADPAGRLQGFAAAVRAPFADAGLLVPEAWPLRLHATIVNTSHVRRGKRAGKKWQRVVIEDAQAILDRYESQVWMEAVPLEKIAICKMSAQPVEENGVVVDAEYEVVAELDF